MHIPIKNWMIFFLICGVNVTNSVGFEDFFFKLASRNLVLILFFNKNFFL